MHKNLSAHAPGLEIIFPQDLITQDEVDSLGAAAKGEIFSRCKSHLDDADIVIALRDGSQVDDGTASETGYFYAKTSPEQKIIGIRTVGMARTFSIKSVAGLARSPVLISGLPSFIGVPRRLLFSHLLAGGFGLSFSSRAFAPDLWSLAEKQPVRIRQDKGPSITLSVAMPHPPRA